MNVHAFGVEALSKFQPRLNSGSRTTVRVLLRVCHLLLLLLLLLLSVLYYAPGTVLQTQAPTYRIRASSTQVRASSTPNSPTLSSAEQG